MAEQYTGQLYTVQPGDNLTEITRKWLRGYVPEYDIPSWVQQIATDNQMVDASKIYPGQTISLPAPPARRFPGNRYETEEGFQTTPMDARGLAAGRIEAAQVRRARKLDAQEAPLYKSAMDVNKLVTFVNMATNSNIAQLRMPSAQGKAQSSSAARAERAATEREIILNEWLKNPPRTQVAVEKFIENKTLSPEGYSFIVNQLAKQYDWGDWVELKKVDPDNPYKPTTIMRRKESPGYAKALEGGFTSGSIEDDMKALQEQIGVAAINKFRTTYSNPTLPDYIAFMKQVTDSSERAALVAYANEQGYDLGYKIFWNRKTRETKEVSQKSENFATLQESADWEEISAQDRFKITNADFMKRAMDSVSREITMIQGQTETEQVDLEVIKKILLNKLAATGSLWLLTVADYDLKEQAKLLQSKSGAALAAKGAYDLSMNGLLEILKDPTKGQEEAMKFVAQQPTLTKEQREHLVKYVRDHYTLQDTRGLEKSNVTITTLDGKSIAVEVMYETKMVNGVPTRTIATDGHGNLMMVPVDKNYTLTKAEKEVLSRSYGDKDMSFNVKLTTSGAVGLSEKIEKNATLKSAASEFLNARGKYMGMQNLLHAAETSIDAMPGQADPNYTVGMNAFDQALVTMWLKIEDQSLVAEGELRAAIDRQPLLKRLWERLRGRGPITTGAQLTPATRFAIMKIGKAAFDTRRGIYLGEMQGEREDVFSKWKSMYRKFYQDDRPFNIAFGPITELIREGVPELDYAQYPAVFGDISEHLSGELGPTAEDAGAKSPQLFWDPKTERPEFEGGKWWIYQMNPDGSRGKFLRTWPIFDEE